MKPKFFFIVIASIMASCSGGQKEAANGNLKISLAQWSLHKAFQDGSLKAENFAAIAKNDFGADAIEYVNGFYKERGSDTAFWKMMRAKADSLNVKSLLIMVDQEGDLGNPDSVQRNTAVENHYKWIDAARILGCHSIRVNAFGEGSKDEVKEAMTRSMQQLCDYAKDINIIIENHGLYSSDAQWVAAIIKGANRSNAGTLPDFGNWCMKMKWGSTEHGKECEEAYDRYAGIAELLPFAKGVSAKSYHFDEQGNETTIDYQKMLDIVKQSGFDGYIGIEYEGSVLSERDGIKATQALLKKVWEN